MVKLGFLQHVVGSNCENLSARVLEALSDDVEYSCLVRECRELEESLKKLYTDSIMRGSAVAVREMKIIFQLDRRRHVDRCQKAPVIAEVASWVGWARLYDAAFDLWVEGCQGIADTQSAK